MQDGTNRLIPKEGAKRGKDFFYSIWLFLFLFSSKGSELSYCYVHYNFTLLLKRVMVQPPNLLCSHLITVNRPVQAELTHKAWPHKARGQWGGNNNEGGHTFPVIFSPELCVCVCAGPLK